MPRNPRGVFFFAAAVLTLAGAFLSFGKRSVSEGFREEEADRPWSTIEDLQVTPPIGCLYVSPHGCHIDEMVWIENRCSKDLRLGGMTLQPNNEAKRYHLIELFRPATGEVDARGVWEDRYDPARPETLRVGGEVDGKKFFLSYTINPSHPRYSEE